MVLVIASAGSGGGVRRFWFFKILIKFCYRYGWSMSHHKNEIPTKIYISILKAAELPLEQGASTT